MSSADEDAAGISASLGDEGAALQRARDKIATMQARAGALDELPRPGMLEDAGSDTDDIQLVSARYERASLIVTSNKPFGRWGEVFGDDVVAAAMIDLPITPRSSA